MKRTNFWKKLPVLFLAAFMLFTVVACNDNTNEPENPGSTESNFTLEQTSVTLDLGKTVTLTPKDAQGEIIWASMDETVATVSNGVVTGVDVGETKIVATNSGKTAVCDVSVVDPLVSVPTLELVNKSKNVYNGLEYPMSAKLHVGEQIIEDATFSWASSDEAVATVDAATGLVKTLKVGTVTITVTCVYEGQTLTDSVDLNVNDVATFTIDTKSVIANPNGSYSLTVSGTRLNQDHTAFESIPQNEFTFASSNEGVAKYNADTQKIETVAAGKADITVSYGLLQDVCEVYVLSADDVTVLTSAEQFEAMEGQDVTGTFLLANDIDFEGVTSSFSDPNDYSDGTPSEFQGFKSFSGTFYGNGFALKNFCLQAPDWAEGNNNPDIRPSFFGEVKEGSEIRNVEMLNFSINPTTIPGVPNNIGHSSLLSSKFSGTLEDVVIEASIKGSNYYTSDGLVHITSFLAYETTETAYFHNIVAYYKFGDRGMQRAITVNGDYTSRNFIMVSDPDTGWLGGGGGTGTTINGPWAAQFHDVADTMKKMINGDPISGLQADPEGFPETVWDYERISGSGNENLPTLLDNIDVARFMN